MINGKSLCSDLMIQAIERAPIGTAFLNSEGYIINVNPFACLLVGCEADELMNRSIHDWIHPDDASLVHSRLAELLKGDQHTNQVELRMLHKLGHMLWVSSTLSAVKDDAGRILGFVVHLIDLTAQKRAYHYAEEVMIQSDKLSMAGQLAAGIAHEIRNPMTSIKGFVQLMRSGSGSKEEYFDIISSEIERIELILGELLLLAKPQGIKYGQKDIRLLLEQVITLLNTQAILNNVEIITRFGTEAAYVKCDENQMKQVFINFIKNAVESMPGGGKLTIHIECDSVDQLVIFFVDEGCGIPESILSRLGEPFYTTKEKGTGLGFMISKKMIEDHCGQVVVFSKPNEGTTIKVTLPLAHTAND
ncbi:ATP-binding protein [Paenibacillus sp. N3/727]|uniref:ATP-binding protein n=1 Tax=Paenibacillus sp. N3/727 TaxID=2925845 RepID=UPI001F53B0EF|nr:ATP-binding protein [Paenibacillus sp. N3/727]UNK17842.1 ATP-binding protein [Paenibacillus sp. N3/727]